MPGRPEGGDQDAEKSQLRESADNDRSRKLPQDPGFQSAKSQTSNCRVTTADDQESAKPQPQDKVCQRFKKIKDSGDSRKSHDTEVQNLEVRDPGVSQRQPNQTGRGPAASVASSTKTTVILDVNPVVRYPLLFFNMALSFVGGGTGALGLYAIFETMDEASDDEETLKKNQLQNLTLLRIELIVTVAGVILFFVSCFGCVGALRENIVLLRVYSGFLTLFTLACLVLGIVAFFMPGNVKAVVQDTLSDSLIVHYRDTPDNQHFVDALQRHLGCCGMSDNFRDWNKNMNCSQPRSYFNCSHLNPGHERCSVPHSCCKRNATHQDVSLFCGRHVLNMSDYDAWFLVYVGNCPDAAHRFIKENVMLTGGICLVFVIVLSFADMITNAVIDEIKVIRKIYFAIAD